jgi:hypothetical protein
MYVSTSSPGESDEDMASPAPEVPGKNMSSTIEYSPPVPPGVALLGQGLDSLQSSGETDREDDVPRQPIRPVQQYPTNPEDQLCAVGK